MRLAGSALPVRRRRGLRHLAADEDRVAPGQLASQTGLLDVVADAEHRLASSGRGQPAVVQLPQPPQLEPLLAHEGDDIAEQRLALYSSWNSTSVSTIRAPAIAPGASQDVELGALDVHLDRVDALTPAPAVQSSIVVSAIASVL